MRALPAWAQEPRQLPRAEAPVDPREDHAADEQDEESTWQEIFHVGRRSFAAVI